MDDDDDDVCLCCVENWSVLLLGCDFWCFAAVPAQALPIVDGIVLDVVCCQHAYFEIKAHQSPAWVDAGLQYLKVVDLLGRNTFAVAAVLQSSLILPLHRLTVEAPSGG